MKAKHKYNTNTQEGARRLAQSIGYKFSIYDMPHMISLCAKAGIKFDGVEYTEPKQQLDNNTTITL